MKKFRKKKDNLDGESTPKKKRKFRFGYWLLVFILTCGLLCFMAGIGFCYYIVKSAPEFDKNNMFEKESTRIFDADGNLYATLGSEKREKVSYDELPQVLIDAIIATEDSRFFQHNGFDAPRFLKASISQVLGRGGGGASTLTMQLSKLEYTDFEDQGIKGIIRKFTDIYMAVFKLEKAFTKEEIIEYYVNIPCMGGNIYGVQQASQYYFGKDVGDINLVEAAMIAGMFQSPNGYNAYINPNDANARKNTVLYLMKRHGYITDDEYKAGTSVEIKDFLDEGVSSTNEYIGFIDTVVADVIEKTGHNPYDVPMDIYTTMRKDKQDVINNFYKTYKFKDSKIQVGVAVVDVKTGALIAVGAGRNKKGANTLNLATFDYQTKRHPGSTIKPILDYGPAIEYENLSTYGPFIDEKTPYGSGYMRNFNGKYKGFMTMRDCLKNSVNTCALQAFNMTTNEQKMEFMTNLGVQPEEGITKLPQSYSVGAFNTATPEILAGAYAAFGNGGYYTKPYSFTKIVYRESEEEYTPEIERKRVMKEQTAYILSTVLTGVTTSRLKVSGTQVATKTGTSSYDTALLKTYGLSSQVIPDSWTSSYTTDYAMAIWYGYPEGLTKDNVKNKYYMRMDHASNERLKIQAALGNKIYEKNAKFKNPGGLTTTEVELETIPAQKPSAYTPSKLKKSFIFISGTEPSEVSNRFSKLTDPTPGTYTLNGKSLTVTWNSPGIPEAADENYLLDYFNKGYTIWAEDYYKKRLSYNSSNIGDFGFAIYLTSGTSSTYVGFTKDTTYNIDLNKYYGTFDGVIIKSIYSKFKSNASDGIKIAFNASGKEDNVYNVTMSNLTKTLNLNDKYSYLDSSSVTSIKLNGNEIKSEVTDLNVSFTSISSKDGKSVQIDSFTSTAGTYKVTYTVTFKHASNSTTKTFIQTVTVK